MASGQFISGKDENRIAQYTTGTAIAAASQAIVSLVELSIGTGNWLITYNTPLNSHEFAVHGRSYAALYANDVLIPGSVTSCRTQETVTYNVQHQVGASVIYRNSSGSDVVIDIGCWIETGTNAYNAIEIPAHGNFPTIIATRID